MKKGETLGSDKGYLIELGMLKLKIPPKINSFLLHMICFLSGYIKKILFSFLTNFSVINQKLRIYKQLIKKLREMLVKL